MARLCALALVTVFLPFALSLELGLGGGLGLGIDLHVPPLNLGTSVNLLLSFDLYIEIIHTHYNKTEGIADCAAGGPPGRAGAHGARNGLSTTNQRWYKNTDNTWYMAVVIDPSFTSDEVNTIYAGMINIQNNSCMRFYIYNEQDLVNAGWDYVRIERQNTGCWSYIGRQGGGKQLLNLAPPACQGCGHCIWAGIVAHELTHAIGFDHQQNTPGRDQYVTIQWNNIQTAARHNFEEDPASQYTAFGAPYDYNSVMHYPKNAFSSNGGDTIVVKNGAAIGQRDGLSSWDGYKINKMHQC